MLLMFTVGMSNVGWMLILGAAMALETNAAWGRKLAQPLGVVLAAAAIFIVIANIA
jgi:predicted metal-binding membrane protein